MIWVIKKCQQDGFLASLRKIKKEIVFPCAKDFGHDIEQKGMISWGTFSPVMRHGCIITSRSLSSQAQSDENLEKQHYGKPKLVFLLGKILQRFFFNYAGILFIDYLHERRTVNVAYYCQLLDEVKLAHRRKVRDVPIWNAIPLRDNARPHMAALIQE